MNTGQLFRALPAMDAVLDRLTACKPLADLPRPLLKEAAEQELNARREQIRLGVITDAADLDLERMLPALTEAVAVRIRPRLRAVINATGVVVHTNLGRSLLAPSAVDAVVRACTRPTNLEFSLETGHRGSRYSHVEDLICRLTGAEQALVVNNNAAAVLLVLDSLVSGKEVVLSRGELVEIGGSFRIPDVMAKSGAILREVGTTNRTHLRDYEDALSPSTGAVMRVHTSNFRVVGFHKSVPMSELAALGRAHNVPVIEDLGSGNMMDFGPGVNVREPTVRESVAQGPDIVCFSADKLLGGPQAGIIVGRGDLVEKIKRNPLNRALRIDKMTVAGLEATLRLYLDEQRAVKEIPTLRMITTHFSRLSAQAGSLARQLRSRLGDRAVIDVVSDESRVGGGANPERGLKTKLVRIAPVGRISLERLTERLRRTDPPLIGRVIEGALCLDVRTLQPGDAQCIPALVSEALHAATEAELPHNRGRKHAKKA